MGRRGRVDCNTGGPGGLQEVTYAVPADKCGLVIGKGKKNMLCFYYIVCIINFIWFDGLTWFLGLMSKKEKGTELNRLQILFFHNENLMRRGCGGACDHPLILSRAHVYSTSGIHWLH